MTITCMARRVVLSTVCGGPINGIHAIGRMTIEAAFLRTLIGTTENRLAYQAAVVASLPVGSAFRQAVAACEVLDVLSVKVIHLREQREHQQSLGVRVSHRTCCVPHENRTMVTDQSA